MLSLGTDCALAALTASRRRGFISGSGMPDLAATVISRLSLENIAERFLSCAPLRCMMFLNLEWPAILLVLARFGLVRRPSPAGRDEQCGQAMARCRSGKPPRACPG